MKKSKGKNPPPPTELLVTVMARLRQAFQKESTPDSACPEPEQVISAALEELPDSEQQQLQDHLVSCRSCLDLYLDVCLAQAEAGDPAGDSLEAAAAAPESSELSWLAALAGKIREGVRALGRPRRLIPAMAAVSLTVFLVVIGSREYFKPAPPRELALEQQEPQGRLQSSASTQEPAAVKPLPAPSAPELSAASPRARKSASFRESTGFAGKLPAGAIQLHLTETPTAGGQISYRADQNVFAYLLRQDRHGKFDLLYSGSLEAGKDYSYPIKNHLLRTDAGTGGATIFLVAAPSPITDLAKRLKELERLGPDQMQLLFPQAAIRSLSLQLP